MWIPFQGVHFFFLQHPGRGKKKIGTKLKIKENNWYMKP